jgi:hypothetical protein
MALARMEIDHWNTHSIALISVEEKSSALMQSFVTTIRVVMSVGGSTSVTTYYACISYHHVSSIDDVKEIPSHVFGTCSFTNLVKLMKRNCFPSPYAAANAIQSAHLSITCMRHL